MNAINSLTEMQRLAWGLSFARGYLELGMIREAERELNRLDAAYQELSEVLSLRSQVLMARRRWRDVVTHARRALTVIPGAAEFYIHATTALDMLGEHDEARRLWQSAPDNVRTSGFFHLHVARVEARLGNVAAARSHLACAIHLDPNLRSVAGRDPNLALVLSELARN